MNENTKWSRNRQNRITSRTTVTVGTNRQNEGVCIEYKYKTTYLLNQKYTVDQVCTCIY